MSDNKYANGKIYEIVCNVTGKRYIGSTICSLEKRARDHKGHYRSYQKGKMHYVTSFAVIENGDYTISLLEAVCCDSKKALEQRERHYIESIDCINRYVPCRTDREYYENNRERVLQYQSVYRKINTERILQYQLEYREANRERIAQRDREYRARKKQEKLSSQEPSTTAT